MLILGISYLRKQLHLTGVVITYYDYLLTSGDEARYIWGCKGSILWIFYFNRYFSILALIPEIMEIFISPSPSWETVCSGLKTYVQVSIVIAQLVTSVTLLLRTYALYDRSRKILAVILVIGFPLIGLIIWSVVTQHADSLTTIGCVVIGTRDVQSKLGFAWVALIAYEMLIFILTVMKTYRERNTTYRTTVGHVGSLMELMCRDGAVYFAIMVCCSTANTVTFYMAPPVLQGCLSRLASSVSVSLISRLIINLRKQYFARRQATNTSLDPEILSLSYDNIPSTVLDDPTGASSEFRTSHFSLVSSNPFPLLSAFHVRTTLWSSVVSQIRKYSSPGLQMSAYMIHESQTQLLVPVNSLILRPGDSITQTMPRFWCGIYYDLVDD
ncbi:hypothetical protein ABKN59_008693 [Abortiporus biennis]